MPKVSVITAYYNRASVLRRTIQSILDQSFEDLELIVVDDCSTDNTVEQLDELVKDVNDSRIRVIRNATNKGFVRSLNEAIESSSGEYIAVQGSGDVSLPERLSRQVELLDRRPEVVAVGCWYANIDDESGATELFRPNADARTDGRTTFTHGEMMMRRSAYEKAGGYRVEFSVGQLTDLGYRMYEYGTFATVPKILYERHLQGDGITYNAEKIIKQAKFLALANQLRQMQSEQIESVLSVVRGQGIDAVISEGDPDVQFTVTERCIRLCIYNRGAEADQLAKHAAQGGRRRVLRAIARGVQGPLSAPLRWLLQTAMAVRRKLKGRTQE